MAAFKNLVFDLGDVIIDIDYQVTVAEFQKLSLINFGEIVSYSTQHEVFDHLERGTITPAQFREALRKYLKPGTTDEQMDDAWNAIFTAFPPKKFELLKDLKTRYKTFALSNTNQIHVDYLQKAAQGLLAAPGFDGFFHGVYYSHDTGFRKPEPEIYEHIMLKENLKPGETFFVDDKLENIEAAKKLGWQAYQLKERDKLFDLLKELKII